MGTDGRWKEMRYEIKVLCVICLGERYAVRVSKAIIKLLPRPLLATKTAMFTLQLMKVMVHIYVCTDSKHNTSCQG